MAIPFTEQLTQALAIPVNSTPPSNASAGTANTGPIDMLKFQRAMAHVICGAAGANANCTSYLLGSNTSNGTFTNISGAPTFTFLNTTGTYAEGTLEIRADQMPAGNRYLQLQTVVLTNAVNYSASLYGYMSSWAPTNQYDSSGPNRQVT